VVTRRARAYEARVRARRARAAGGLAPEGAAHDPVDEAAAVDEAAGAPAPDPVPDPVRGTPAGLFPLLSGPVQVVAGEAFTVRPVTGAAAAKAYTCPWCLQAIAPRVPHVVVWPVQNRLDGAEGLSVRRHWHRHCWSSHVRTAASGRPR